MTHTVSLPPSQRGSAPLNETAVPLNPSAISAQIPIACRIVSRARLGWRAPTNCATCTANPAATAMPIPLISHVVLATSPIEAEASAPSEPTMPASIYCMTIDEISARMAGTLNRSTIHIFSFISASLLSRSF